MSSETARLAMGMAALIRRTPSLWALCGIWRPTLRMLAAGRPVSADDIAAATGSPVARIRDALSGAPNAVWDADDRLIGLGITLRPSSYHVRLPDRDLYALSALDPFLLAAVQRQPVRVSASCRVTGTPIRVGLASEDVLHVEPETAVVSVLRRPEDFGMLPPVADARQLFFRSAAAARSWLVIHQEYQVLSVRDVHVLACRFVAGCRESRAGQHGR